MEWTADSSGSIGNFSPVIVVNLAISFGAIMLLFQFFTIE